MPRYVEVNSSAAPGLGEEDCLYPISPRLLPTSSPYVQPHPLTSYQLHNILRSPTPLLASHLTDLPVNCPLFNYSYPLTSPPHHSAIRPISGTRILHDLQESQTQMLQMRHSATLRR